MSSSPVSAHDRSKPPRFSAEVELASGGMGYVELARCSTPGYPPVVAVKRLLPHLSRDADLVSAFLDEAWMTASLKHPNIVELVASGKDDRGLFLALELVRGPPLSALLKGHRKLPVDIAVYIARSVAAGLGAAHALVGTDGHPLGIVHRDVTPSNVLLAPDGSVKITDFGVAKANRYFARTHTATGVLKGKVPYMSPEYALAKPVDAKSDLYSLGVVLFEMLAGHRPFDSESDVLLLRTITEEPPPSLTELGIEPELAHIVERLLAKRPEDRSEDAESLCFELDAFIAQRGRSMDELRRELGELVQKELGSAVDQIASLVRLLEGDENPAPTAILSPSQPPPPLGPPTRALPLERPSVLSRARVPRKHRALAIGVGVGGVLGLFLLGVVVVSSLAREAEPPIESAEPITLPVVAPLPVTTETQPAAIVPPTPPPTLSSVASAKPPKPSRPPTVRPRRSCTKDNPDYPMCLKR